MKKIFALILSLALFMGVMPVAAEEEITVYFSMKTDTGVWVEETELSLPQGSSAKDALKKVLEDNEDLQAFGMEEGYVTAFQKGEETLSQMDKGPLSGWGYKVNEKMPPVAFDSYILEDGDELLWYYTVDFTLEFEEEPSLPFTDVENHWATDAISWAYERGLMKGVAEDEFAPEFPVSRAMLVTVLWRLEGMPQVNLIMPFEDVDTESYYAEAVRWAVAEGIVKGASGTFFFPDSSITRQDFAVILHRYAEYKGIDVSVGEDTNILSYEDVFEVSEYAFPALQWSAGAGVMSGRTPSTLNPKETASRAETATILMRSLSE